MNSSYYLETQRGFTICTYNVLAQKLVQPSRFAFSQKAALRWKNRAQLFSSQIPTLNPDILCLQEVDSSTYDSYWLTLLKSLGYECFFVDKLGMQETASHGVVIAYKRHKFILLSEYGLNFEDLGLIASDQAEKDSIGQRNVAQISLFLPIDTWVEMLTKSPIKDDVAPSAEDAQQFPILCVTNNHLNWRYYCNYTKHRQLVALRHATQAVMHLAPKYVTIHDIKKVSVAVDNLKQLHCLTQKYNDVLFPVSKTALKSPVQDDPDMTAPPAVINNTKTILSRIAAQERIIYSSLFFHFPQFMPFFTDLDQSPSHSLEQQPQQPCLSRFLSNQSQFRLVMDSFIGHVDVQTPSVSSTSSSRSFATVPVMISTGDFNLTTKTTCLPFHQNGVLPSLLPCYANHAKFKQIAASFTQLQSIIKQSEFDLKQQRLQLDNLQSLYESNQLSSVTWANTTTPLSSNQTQLFSAIRYALEIDFKYAFQRAHRHIHVFQGQTFVTTFDQGSHPTSDNTTETSSGSIESLTNQQTKFIRLFTDDYSQRTQIDPIDWLAEHIAQELPIVAVSETRPEASQLPDTEELAHGELFCEIKSKLQHLFEHTYFSPYLASLTPLHSLLFLLLSALMSARHWDIGLSLSKENVSYARDQVLLWQWSSCAEDMINMWPTELVDAAKYWLWVNFGQKTSHMIKRLLHLSNVPNLSDVSNQDDLQSEPNQSIDIAPHLASLPSYCVVQDLSFAHLPNFSQSDLLPLTYSQQQRFLEFIMWLQAMVHFLGLDINNTVLPTTHGPSFASQSLSYGQQQLEQARKGADAPPFVNDGLILIGGVDLAIHLTFGLPINDKTTPVTPNEFHSICERYVDEFVSKFHFYFPVAISESSSVSLSDDQGNAVPKNGSDAPAISRGRVHIPLNRAARLSPEMVFQSLLSHAADIALVTTGIQLPPLTTSDQNNQTQPQQRWALNPPPPSCAFSLPNSHHDTTTPSQQFPMSRLSNTPYLASPNTFTLILEQQQHQLSSRLSTDDSGRGDTPQPFSNIARALLSPHIFSEKAMYQAHLIQHDPFKVFLQRLVDCILIGFSPDDDTSCHVWSELLAPFIPDVKTTLLNATTRHLAPYPQLSSVFSSYPFLSPNKLSPSSPVSTISIHPMWNNITDQSVPFSMSYSMCLAQLLSAQSQHQAALPRLATCRYCQPTYQAFLQTYTRQNHSSNESFQNALFRDESSHCYCTQLFAGVPVTNYRPEWSGTLDHIEISRKLTDKQPSLSPIALRQMEGTDLITFQSSIPNTSFPSDHLPLMAQLQWE